MSEIEGYMIQAITALAFCFGFLFYLFYLRSKYQRMSVDHVQCRFITPEGTGYTKLLRVDNGFVDLKYKDKKGKEKSKVYRVGELATYMIDFPEGWVPRFLKTRIKEIIFDENCFEPLSNLNGDPLLSPEILANVVNEKFTEVAVEHSREEAEREKKAKKAMIPGSLYMLLILNMLLIVGGLALLYFKMSDWGDILQRIAAGLGV